LRLQTASDCIPHPYYICTKCFSTLICCGWTYGCTLTLLYLCRWGLIFSKVGVWVRANGIVVSWLRLQTASEGIPHPYHMYTKCFSTLICCGWMDGHMGAPLPCYTCVSGGEFLENWGVGKAKWYCSFMVEATNSFRLHPTSISYVYKVF
jgi:hypothetical protein